MSVEPEPLELSFSRESLAGLLMISAELNGPMHRLLERNVDGDLSDIEQAELATLVQMTQFAQLLATVTQEPTDHAQVP